MMTLIRVRVYKSSGSSLGPTFKLQPTFESRPQRVGRIQCAMEFLPAFGVLQPWSCCHLPKTGSLSDPISQLTGSPATQTELHVDIIVGRITENQIIRDEERNLYCNFRGPEVNFQHLHGVAHNCLYLKLQGM